MINILQNEITEENGTPCGMLLCEHHLICSECGADPYPYEGHISDCSKIIEWKERKNTVEREFKDKDRSRKL